MSPIFPNTKYITIEKTQSQKNNMHRIMHCHNSQYISNMSFAPMFFFPNPCAKNIFIYVSPNLFVYIEILNHLRNKPLFLNLLPMFKRRIMVSDHMCSIKDSNLYAFLGATDFKSALSADFNNRAYYFFSTSHTLVLVEISSQSAQQPPYPTLS